MRYTLINGLCLLAISPFTALALPVNPNDQGGQWDPSGQYRKGHYDANGDFIPNEGSNQVGWNENGQNYQNGQYYQNGQNSQNGQWRGKDWYQNNGWNRNGLSNNWQRRSLPSQSLKAEELREDGNLGAGLPNFGAPGAYIPGTGIHARNWPYDQNNNQNGWTDSNGQWHQGNQNNQGGWTDAKGVWHPNNHNGQNTQNGAGWTDANGVWHSTDYSQGWTDANGVWHSTDYSKGWTDANGVWHNNPNDGLNNNQGGWTDANGQWHANQKRDIVPDVGAPFPGIYNYDHSTAVNDAATANYILHVPRYYPNDDHYDNYREDEEANRHREHEVDRETAEDVASVLLPGSIFARNYPQAQNNWKNNDNDNNGWNHNAPQASPVASYNDEAHDDDDDHHKDKGINATGEKSE